MRINLFSQPSPTANRQQQLPGRLQFALLVTLLPIAMNSPATQDDTPIAEEPPWYNIDLAIYRQSRSLSQSEQWISPDGISLRFPNRIISLTAADTENETLDAQPKGRAFTQREISDDVFRQTVTKLRQHSSFGMLYQASWRQPMVAEAEAYPILIQTGRWLDAYPEVEGYVRLHLSRYLHVKVDLAIQDYERQVLPTESEFDWLSTDSETTFLTNQPVSIPFTWADSAVRDQAQAPQASTEKTWVVPVRSMALQTSRRMRSGELHYIDHPIIGIVIKVTPVKLPDITESTAPDDTKSVPGTVNRTP